VVKEIPKSAKILAAHFWPGPLTLVLPRKEIVPDLVSSGLPTVGVRVPDHPLTLELLKAVPFPLACPSANPFGYISPTTPKHVSDQLGDQINYILDGGPCRVGIESTIIGFEKGVPVIYRPGGIPGEDIEKVVGSISIKTTSDKPVAPGMLSSHYAPAKSLLIGNIRELIAHYGHKKSGVLSFNDHFDQVDDEFQIQLSPEGDLAQAAQNLFAALRKLDAMDIRYIFTELVPDYGLGVAINNRLRRAASN
jgi:L-threonylcarbamoyladenylate synthase